MSGQTRRRRGPTGGGSRLGTLFVAAMMGLTMLGVGTAAAVTTANGGFENGTLTGWTTVSEGGGGWFDYTGTTAPVSRLVIPAPPEGARAAVADQSGPGSHILYQDLVLEPAQSHSLGFFAYYENRAGSFLTPDTLSHSGVANQQYRIDIMQPTAAVSSVAASDVLATVFAQRSATRRRWPRPRRHSTSPRGRDRPFDSGSPLWTTWAASSPGSTRWR